MSASAWHFLSELKALALALHDNILFFGHDVDIVTGPV